jgi:ABC-type transport system involved in multi-copper enzyme maturation permease subunit
VLKLRRRKGLMALAVALTILPMTVGYGIAIFQHVTDPAANGAPGGVENFRGGLNVLSLLAGICAVLVGATLGAADAETGTFRDLVLTGRSRTSLYLSRFPAGMLIVLTLTGFAFLLATVVSITFAGEREAPSASLIAGSAGWLSLSVTSSLVIAIAVSSLGASRSLSVGGLLAWQLGITNLLLALEFLGATREALLPAAVGHFTPSQLELDRAVDGSTTAALITIAVWLAGAGVAGWWRTARRDA